MKSQYWIILLVAAAVAVGIFAWGPWKGGPSAGNLVSNALSSETLEQRVHAAVELSMRKEGPEAVPALRRLAAETR